MKQQKRLARRAGNPRPKPAPRGVLSLRRMVLSRIPTTWLHPLLTGPDAVVGKPPFWCPDIEMLLGAIRQSVERVFAEDARKPRRKPKAAAKRAPKKSRRGSPRAGE